MKKIGIIIFLAILKIIYIPIKLLKVQPKVTYISRQSNKSTLDFKLIVDEMESNYFDVKNVVLAKKLEKNIKSIISYFFHMFVQMYHIATSKVVILDGYCIVASVLKHKKETKIIQIWHAESAIKKFGYQTLGKNSGTENEIAKLMCMHKNYDYVLCPSEITKEHFVEAFNVKEENIKYLGLPRLDYILDDNDIEKEKIYKEYPILKEKINILYVPTFRKFKKVNVDEIVKKIDTFKYNLIVKLHPLDQKNYEYMQKDGVIYDNNFNTYDLAKVSDKIITDYSSLAMEISILNKPMYFYTYDIEEYRQDPGLNFDFAKESIGKYQTTNAVELLELIDKEYDYTVLEEFKNRYITINYNNCTKQICKFIMRLINNEYKEEFNTTSEEKLNV